MTAFGGVEGEVEGEEGTRWARAVKAGDIAAWESITNRVIIATDVQRDLVKCIGRQKVYKGYV